eukprot:sb/3479436/
MFIGYSENCCKQPIKTRYLCHVTGCIPIRDEDNVEDLYVIRKFPGGRVGIEYVVPGGNLDDDIIVRDFGFFGETPLLTKKKADMMNPTNQSDRFLPPQVFAEVPCDCLLIPKYIFYAMLDRFPMFKSQMLLVCHSRLSLQGLNPMEYAPFLKNAFLEALSDPNAVNSSEDILELASQARLDHQGLKEFRNKNLNDLSVFRKQNKDVFEKAGASSKQTPIDITRKEKEVHVSVSIHGDDVKTHSEIVEQLRDCRVTTLRECMFTNSDELSGLARRI